MKILVGDKWNVDFETPVRMLPDQKERFLNFMKTLFSVVEEIPSQETRSERLGDRFFFRKWTIDEYAVLADITKSTSEVWDELGRSPMSVEMKRGSLMPVLLRWANENGYDLVKGNIKELIKKFLSEQKNLKMKRREDIKYLEQLESEESDYPKALERLKNLKSSGMFNESKYKEGLKELEVNRQKRLEEIDELKERLDLE